MHINKESLKQMNRVRRLNLINAITGIKPANLIGTRSSQFGSNLSIVSSVVHLGSDPALLGFILRPNADVIRDTYVNIRETGYFTINHIHQSFIERAHYTSAKFDRGVSEFERVGLTEEFTHEFPAPFVAESKVKIGLKYIDEHYIPQNGTRLIIGEIIELFLPEDALDDKGYLRLDHLFDVGIGGLNSYYSLKRMQSYPYARVNELPDFNIKQYDEGKPAH